MLITSSKDKTLKFWRIKQLRRQEEPSRPADHTYQANFQERPQPLLRNRGAYDRDDPLMGGDDDHRNHPQTAQSEAKEEIKQLPQRANPKQDFSKKKADESDEDLTGWDT